MPRIPDDVIERIKHEVSVQRLAEAQGIQLKKHGADLLGLCPFHDDKEPSLVITPTKNLWHCLGACQVGGSVIDWVMKLEGVSFRHAVELLQNDYQPGATKPVKRSTVNKLDVPFETDIADQQLLNRVIAYYHDTLKQHPDALAYLKKRGIHRDAIDQFTLGVANRSLGYRLPKANRKDGAAIRGQLQNIGIYRDSGHEHFSGSLIIPVLDEHGNVQEVYGRKLLDNLRVGTPKHLYLPGPHRGIFNVVALQSSKEIILCESLIDALTFWCAGYRNVTTSYGIEGFTKAHLAAFKQYEIERVLIAYDRDDAGNQAAEKLSKQLMQEGIDCYRIQFPKGMDANDYALQVTPASKSLGVVIRSAEWMGTGRKKPVTTELINDEAAKEETIIKDDEPSSLAAELETVIEDVLPASPLPETTKGPADTAVNENETIITLGDRRYRIRGLNKNLSYDVLKINLLVSRHELVHVDTFDLYQSRPRNTFIKQAAIELGINDDIIKTDLGKLLLKLELLQDQQIKAELEENKQSPVATMTKEDAENALALLKAPDLLDRIVEDVTRCGIVGEQTNTLVSYLAAISRKLDNPLAVIIQSTSAAGKSSLMEAVLRFIPADDKHQYSAMTGQSLYYLGETNLKHKVLAIAEEEGAAQAAYALKLLQSEGQLTIASTTKDPDSGDLTTKEYKVEGPVMLFLTTTAIDIDDELLNRCLVLTVNEDREQTQAIHQLQRKKRTLAGLIQKSEREQLLKQHQNAQRLLKPLAVVNPYAEQLTFLNNQTRTRRDHEKYLTLIDSIALLHQYQRPVKTIQQGNRTLEYIETTISDIETANQLAHEVLGRTLDELPPQTRKLLSLIDTMVTEHCRQQKLDRQHYHFSRRAIREYTGWTDNQLKVHCYRLQEMEYLLVHQGGRGKVIQYELLYDGQNDDTQRHLMGLIDTGTLKQHYDAQKLGENAKKRGSSCGQVGLKLQSGWRDQTQRKANHHNASRDNDDEPCSDAYIKGNHADASYTQTPSLVAVSK
jgi:DNA primase catalytic core